MSPVHTPRSPQFRLRFPVPEGILALIREKLALLFWKSHSSLSVGLSGAVLRPEITANSTYLKENLFSNDLEYGESGKTPVMGIGIFRIDAGRYIRVVSESPQFRLISVKRENRDQSRSRKIAICRSLFFCDLGLSGFSDKNGLITGLKNIPNRPFWMGDRRSDGRVDQ